MCVNARSVCTAGVNVVNRVTAGSLNLALSSSPSSQIFVARGLTPVLGLENLIPSLAGLKRDLRKTLLC